MANLVSEILAAAGQPATVRIGRVASINPLSVTLQGAVLATDAYGVLDSYIPTLGDSIVLLGQSKATGSDPSSWLVLGHADDPTTVTVISSETVAAFAAGGGSTTSAVYTVIATVVGVAFVAPASGKVLISWRSGLDNTAADTKGVVSWEIRTGAVVGAGTVIVAASDDRAIGLRGTDEVEIGASSLVAAGTLTPGSAYNAQLMYARQVGTGTSAFARGEIVVQPVV